MDKVLGQLKAIVGGVTAAVAVAVAEAQVAAIEWWHVAVAAVFAYAAVWVAKNRPQA